MTDDHHLFARIPAWFRDGRWVTKDGAPLSVKPGTMATFEIGEEALKTLGWEEVLTVPIRAKFLPTGTPLRIALSLGQPKDIAPAHLEHLLPPDAMYRRVVWDQKSWMTQDNRFFEVTLAEPDVQPLIPFTLPEGGLFVSDDGSGKLKVETGPLHLAKGVLTQTPKSLNHLLTLLSEVYEVHRASHTGSIFQRVFYEERDKRWCPLGFLRDCRNDAPEGSLAGDFWKTAGDADA